MMKNKKEERQEPIIWDSEMELGLDEFFHDARELGLEYAIYVIDASGELNSVWATSKDDLIECFNLFSSKCYFGRTQLLSVAIEVGFFDDVKGN